MIKIRVILFLMVLLPLELFAWGKRGHDVVAYIAECNLSSDARCEVEELLGGRSMVYFANWMDSASRTREYAYSYEWHYFNMELSEDVSTARRSRGGDLLYAAQRLERVLRGEDDGKDRLSRSVALKMFIHVIADMHQPMHLGRSEDDGGGKIPVVYFVESTSLHAMWDYHLVEGCHSWSYSEWQYQVDRLSADEERLVVDGEYVDWIDETHAITRKIYRATPRESRVFYEYVDEYAPIVEQQLLYAGLRLAHLLNSIMTNE